MTDRFKSIAKQVLAFRLTAFIGALLVLVGYILGVITTYNLALSILAQHS
jgi:hypothetical protein